MSSQVICAFTYKSYYYEQRTTGKQDSYQRRKHNTDTWRPVKSSIFQNVSSLASQQVRRWNRGDYS